MQCGRTFRLAFLLILISETALAQAPRWKAVEAEADTLYNHQDFAGALKLYSKAIDANKLKDGQYEDKDVYNCLYKRAVCYYSTQEYTKALKDLELFSPVYPKAPQPRLLKAFIYRELNDIDKQLVNLQEAMELIPPNADYLKWRGLLYLQKNDYVHAIKDVKAARDFQDDPEVQTYLGLCYYNLDKKDSAYMSFNKAIEMDATYIAPYLYAGSVSLQDGAYDRSLEYLNLALRLDPKNKEALFYKGAALVELKKFDEGCSCLNRAFYAGFDDAVDYLKEYCYEVEN